ncbi:MAG: adenylosuccinate synthetase [Bacilli bacterium]|nr:adenylosuccinate synthetase [Bacilli bacterium]
MIKNVISVIDGAAGSCGKAKVVGEIATDKTINLGAAITNCMPNAGHTFVDEQGRSIIFRNIPVSCVNPQTELFIGPGSAIDMDVFIDEYERVKHLLNGRKIYVHEMVPLIEERHKQYEKEHIKSGSTFKGCGAVTQEKVIRDKRLAFFKTFENAVVCSNDEWLEKLYTHLDNPNEYVILEGAQGCDLDLNHSGNYPYVTSRNVSTSQLLADSGISPERLLQTIMVVRPFPIRISNITKTGDIIYTGANGTGKELTWTEINIASQFGWYPYEGMLNDFKIEYEEDEFLTFVQKDLVRCPEIYLKQIFGENYKDINLKEVTLLQALEIERLYHKSIGEREYESNYIELPFTETKDSPTLIVDLSEQTTVTKMERRVFDLDIKKLINNIHINTPSSLYLNFFQHLSYNHKGIIGNYDDINFEKPIREYLAWLENNTGIDISTLGTGSRNGERIKRKELIRR